MDFNANLQRVLGSPAAGVPLAPPWLPRSHPGPMDQPAAVPAEDAIRDEILRQTAARGPGRSICPSEVARALAGGGEDGPWRSLMGPVRRAAFGLARAGHVESSARASRSRPRPRAA